MNRYLYLFILLMLGCFADVSQASEPTTDSTKVKVGFVYDLDFDMQFDNREFDGMTNEIISPSAFCVTFCNRFLV